jgi:hypothetical protein
MQRLAPIDKKLTMFGQKIFLANELGGVSGVYFSWCQLVKMQQKHPIVKIS